MRTIHLNHLGNPYRPGAAIVRALVGPALEAIGPREWFKKQKKLFSNRVMWSDWDDLEDWQKEAAYEIVRDEIGDEPDEDGTIHTDADLEDVENDTFKIVTRRRTYFVCKDGDVARREAIAKVHGDLDEPGLFSQDWLRQFINLDRLKSHLKSDEEESTRNGMDDEYPSYEDKRDYLIKRGDLDEDDFTEIDDEGDTVEKEIDGDLESTIDSAWEAHIEKLVDDRLDDPLEYLAEIYGEEDACKQAIEMVGIDRDEAAEAAVDADGVGHFLGSYDGEEHKCRGDAVYFIQ